MNRFSQKDVLKGNIYTASSLNRYLYVQNDPINFIDPSGMLLEGILDKIGTGIKSIADSVKGFVNTAKTTASRIVNDIKAAVFGDDNSPAAEKAVTAPVPHKSNTDKITIPTTSKGKSLTKQVLPKFDDVEFTEKQESKEQVSPNSPEVDLLMRTFKCEQEDTEETVYVLFSNYDKSTSSRSDFTDAANYILLESVDEKNVVFIAVNTKDDFTAAWDAIPDETSEAYFLFHCNGESLIFEDGSSTEAYNIWGRNTLGKEIGNISSLPEKNIDTLYLYACNSGNLTLAEIGNVAQAFSLLTDGSVIGVDGELSYGAPIADDRYNVYFPRLSSNQRNFHKKSGYLNSPEGFVEYRDGEVYEVIGGLPTTLEACWKWIMLHEEN